MFSLSHGLALLVLILAIVSLFLLRNRINNNRSLEKKTRVFIAILMIILEWVYYAWVISRSGFMLSLLPLGLCAISMYMTAIALLTNSERIFKILYPWAVTGALLSLLVADMTFEFPHFRFFHYFGNHSLFLFGNLYLIFVSGYRIKYKDILKSSFILLCLAIPIYFINPILDTNHMFLRELPNEVSFLFGWMGDPWWVFGFSFGIFFLFHLLYLPFLFSEKKA